MNSHRSLRTFILVATLAANQCQAFQITTTAKTQLAAREIQDFIARPVHWPEIVASSDRVECSNPRSSTDTPLKRGATVREYFGLGLLSVTWTCEESKPGTLVVRSPDGVPGIANDCSMAFDFSEQGQVKLTMGYEPQSIIAWLATPVLVVDNWIALNVLLPAAVDPNPLQSFRKLMGILYGIAGVSHFVDLVWGPSALLVAAGAPVFQDLPLEGQAYALLWCLTGPLSFAASKSNQARVADAGLVVYALVEIIGAALTPRSDTLVNAVAVQAIVLAAWLYSRSKKN